MKKASISQQLAKLAIPPLLFAASFLAPHAGQAVYNRNINRIFYLSSNQCRYLEDYHRRIERLLDPEHQYAPIHVGLSEVSSVMQIPGVLETKVAPQAAGSNFTSIVFPSYSFHSVFTASLLGDNAITELGRYPENSSNLPVVSRSLRELSAGDVEVNPAIIDEMRRAFAKTIFLNALGNDGNDRSSQTITEYHNVPLYIGVGSTTLFSDGHIEVPKYSQNPKGATVLYAPDNVPGMTPRGNCTMREGTSVATPLVAHAIVPIIAKYPEYPELVHWAVTMTATPLDIVMDKEKLTPGMSKGGGMVNPEAAMNLMDWIMEKGYQKVEFKEMHRIGGKAEEDSEKHITRKTFEFKVPDDIKPLQYLFYYDLGPNAGDVKITLKDESGETILRSESDKSNLNEKESFITKGTLQLDARNGRKGAVMHLTIEGAYIPDAPQVELIIRGMDAKHPLAAITSDTIPTIADPKKNTYVDALKAYTEHYAKTNDKTGRLDAADDDLPPRQIENETVMMAGSAIYLGAQLAWQAYLALTGRGVLAELVQGMGGKKDEKKRGRG